MYFLDKQVQFKSINNLKTKNISSEQFYKMYSFDNILVIFWSYFIDIVILLF